MDLTEYQQRKHLIKGLDYLRRHVIESHRAGDGMQVLHYSTVALNRSIEFGKNNPEFKLKMHEIRWAFIFGMYWLIHTNFLVLVADGFKHIDCEGDNHTDSQTIILIHKLLSEPELLIDLELVDEISTDWWSKRGSIERADIEEDFIAISFAIELIWCKFPLQNYWNELLAKWIKTIPDNNCFRSYLEDLKKRLEYQTGFFTGKAFLDHAQSQLLIKDNIQHSLFEGWVAFYNLQFEELADRLQILRNQIGIGSNNFHPFFELINQSRIYLLGYKKNKEEKIDNTEQDNEKPESWMISHSRSFLANTRQPLQQFQHLRKSYAESQFLSVAMSGFPSDSHGQQRLATLRMAMLNSLQALRAWDVGSWQKWLSIKARSILEIGAFGNNTQAVISGILESVRAHSVPKPNTDPHFEKCLLLLDTLNSNERQFVVRHLIDSPPIEWRSAYTIFKTLSDSIPEDMLSELADWSSKVELTDLQKTHHTSTFIDIWDNILQIAPNNKALIDQLASVIKKLTCDPTCWQHSHFVIIAAITEGSHTLASKLCELLISTKCDQSIFKDWRFSIIYNVIEMKPEFSNSLLPFLKEDATKQNNIFNLQRLKQYESKLSGQSNTEDPTLKDIFKKKIFQSIESSENLNRASIFGLQRFNESVKLFNWRKTEIDLVNKLIDAIDNENICYYGKVDFILILSELVRLGPKSQARKIAKRAIVWLVNGIVGQSIDIVGPLERTQWRGFDDYRGNLLRLILECALKCPNQIDNDIIEWLLINQNSLLPDYALYLLEIEFALLSSFNEKSFKSFPLLFSLAESTALVSIDEKPLHVSIAFESIVLSVRKKEFETILVEKNIWVRTFLNQWIHRLTFLSNLPSPEVRESVARTVKLWIQSDLPKREEIFEIRDRLLQDCRLRVKYAINFTEENKKNET